MDRRVLIVRRWLLLFGLLVLGLCFPRLWLGFGLILGPVVWTRTSGGTTGVLIHPDGAGGWKVAVGDSEDATCECCGEANVCPDRCNQPSPTSATIVIAGIANSGGCTDCATLNATYIVPTHPSLGCGGVSNDIPDTICHRGGVGGSSLTWLVQLVGTTARFFVELVPICDGAGIPQIQWLYNYPGTAPVDCTLNSQSIPLTVSAAACFASGACDFSAATCTVTTAQ